MKRACSLLIIGGMLCACTPATESAQKQKLSVAVSIYPLAFLAERVGGDAVEVTTVTPPGTEPHDFEPSPSSIAAANDADLFLWNGEGADPWADGVAEARGEKPTLRFTEFPELLPVPGSGSGGALADEHDRHGVRGDPHVWLNPLILVSGADLIANALAEIDPVRAEAYHKRAAALMRELHELDREFSTGLKECALTRIVVSHDAFRYLASRYGFETVAIAGLSPEAEPSPKALAAITDLVKADGIRYVFTEPLNDTRLAETVSRETGAATLVLHPLEGLSDEEITDGETYLTVMRQNLEALRSALQCE